MTAANNTEKWKACPLGTLSRVVSRPVILSDA